MWSNNHKVFSATYVLEGSKKTEFTERAGLAVLKPECSFNIERVYIDCGLTTIHLIFIAVNYRAVAIAYW